MTPLTVPARLESLKAISDYVLKVAELAGLDKRRTYRLRLAVDEIATNIVTHGAADQMVTVRAAVAEATLTVLVEDTGRPFNPLSIPAPDSLRRPLDQRPTGGLGVYLATRGVDGFVYERVGRCNRNIFTMHLALPQRSTVG